MKTKIINYDFIYLSYDEPNAEKNYADLCSKIPWAKRVHGVKGSDNAHKACADAADTDRFIIIDGDNRIRPEFVNYQIDIDETQDTSNSVISWVARNQINGLMYGNGGIKCWTKDIVRNMKTHENSEKNNPFTQVDFCWNINYIQMDECFSDVYNNATPHQAWRAGFREGVKMSLHNGLPLESKSHLIQTHWKNLHRLYIWTMVGSDVKNGLWAILGARQGLFKSLCSDWDYTNVRDFEYLNNLWDTEVKNLNTGIGQLKNEIVDLGQALIDDLDIPISAEPLSSQQSVFFKTVYQNPSRSGNQLARLSNIDVLDDEEYDIVMITYGEPNADNNYNNLKKRFPRAKRIDNVTGIHNAHKEAARICTTPMFWVVDGDAVIDENFNFDYRVKLGDSRSVHVWRCINPVNGLVYGYGGVKLLPRMLTLNMDTVKPDMTTSISQSFKVMDSISNTTKFDTDPFNAWKSAFRECSKLASKVIDRQNNRETDERLHVWCTVGEDTLFGEYVIDGAREGKKYGESNKGNIESLKKINDFEWLKRQYNARNL